MAGSPNYNFPYPVVDGPPSIPYDVEQLADAVDAELKARHDRRTRRYPTAGPGGPVLLDGDGVWKDLATVTATVRGQNCTAQFWANYQNANSGMNRTTVWRLLVGSTVLWVGQGDAPYRAGDIPRVTIGFSKDTAPAAGSRVFKLQAYSTALNSVEVVDAVLSVTEWEG